MDRELEGTTTPTQPHDEASDKFVGQWSRLVSTTNWEKGRIIHQWRAALIAENASSTEYSDEAWSRMVGGVTGQHAGRLRRVFERFGDVYTQYDGLYWSHFQASLDWDDGEMWLEGAIHNQWSVAAMRRQRWETMGAVKSEEPRDEDVVAAEVDEDFSATDSTDEPADENQRAPNDAIVDDYMAEARSPAGPDFGDDDETSGSGHDPDERGESSVKRDVQASIQPFADLPDLPEDLTAAMESFQLAILFHKQDEWRAVSCTDVLSCLDALKLLAQAP